MKLVDLHAHTTASDGTLIPSELVELAHNKGLSAIAITDHDTTDGIIEAKMKGEKVGIEVIPGIELSADYGDFPMHILGLFIDTESPGLLEAIKKLKKYRDERNIKILKKLSEFGINLDKKEISESFSGNIGRLHFAYKIVQRGYANSVKEALDKYLVWGKPAYVHRQKLSPKEAIKLIKDSGGVSVLAHPYALSFSSKKLEETIKELKSFGLDGIEVYYSEHSKKQVKFLESIARKYSLAVSGGSDFHGALRPKVKLGTGINGNLKVPYTIVENMKKLRK